MLKIDVKTTGIEMTDGIAAAIRQKIGSLDKFLAHVGTPREARVEVGRTTEHHRKGEVFRVETNLRIPGKVLRAVAVSYRLYDAIDLVKDELKREITKAVRSKVDAARAGVREAKAQGTETDLLAS